MTACRRMAVMGMAALLGCAAWGQVTFRYFYDGNGQLFRVLDSSGNLVEYDYDSGGNPTAIRRSVVTAGSLAILNLVPQRGAPGTTVTIYGQNFSAVAAGDTVMFNGVAATVISASSTALVVQAPGGVTTGPVSVTVNGTTVTSGNLNFTVPNLPTITSISPATGYLGEMVTIDVQGANLTNATFAFQGAGPIGVTNVNISSGTQASFTANIGQVGGNFVLVGTNDFGSGSPVPTTANTFRVYEPPGDNYTSVRLSVFNTYIPLGTEPGVPPGSNAATQNLSTFNTYYPPGTEPGVPPGSNAITQAFSTFNTYYPPGTGPGVPAGSNFAYELFSTENTNVNTQMAPAISISPLRTAVGSVSGASESANLTTLVAGETIQIAIASSAGFLPQLQFKVNGAVLASSATGSLNTYFTVPYGVKSLTLGAAGTTAYGQEVESLPEQISVIQDSGLTIAGRTVDAGGSPAPGVPLTWQANGLTAEYYQFNRQLSEIPDLTGLQPARTAYVTDLNYPNPQQVFGQDPVGVGLGANYAARFHGTLSIAKAGDYQFQLNAEMGARLLIDGVAVTDASSTAVSTTLSAGEHDMELIYYESGGAAAVQLLWTPPGGAQEVVPPSALTTANATLISGADGRFQVTVPAALSGVHIVTSSGRDSVVLGQ